MSDCLSEVGIFSQVRTQSQLHTLFILYSIHIAFGIHFCSLRRYTGSISGNTKGTIAIHPLEIVSRELVEHPLYSTEVSRTLL